MLYYLFTTSFATVNQITYEESKQKQNGAARVASNALHTLSHQYIN